MLSSKAKEAWERREAAFRELKMADEIYRSFPNRRNRAARGVKISRYHALQKEFLSMIGGLQ